MNKASRKGEAIVLLSGGLDSATAAAWALAEGYSVTAISFDYGQRHRIELRAAKAVADDLGITDHVSIAIDLAAFGASALVDKSIDVPKNRSENVISNGIPVTYVPARNTVFLSLALALAEARNASSIVLGVNSIDYSGYPDCRPEFLNAFETLANLATKSGVEGTQFSLLAPLVSLTKPGDHRIRSITWCRLRADNKLLRSERERTTMWGMRFMRHPRGWIFSSEHA